MAEGALPADLPRAANRNLAVRVTPDAARHVRAGHPWVFDRAVTRVSGGRHGDGTGEPGDLAVIFDQDRDFLAVGLFDPVSPIRIKVLHRGEPTPIDLGFWAGRVAESVARRAPVARSGHITGYRLVHGENDGLPGLVLDRYDDTAVLKIYSASWFPHLADVLAVIRAVVDPVTVVLRLSRSVAGGQTFGLRDGMTVLGPQPTGPVLFREHDLMFEADVVRGQKTGYFLDQRDNRALVGSLSSGARVLDVFCCSGGFSVHAAAGNATEVVSIDRSSPAIDATARNLRLNAHLPAVARCRAVGTVGDAFDLMEQLARRHERFDTVVVDPPSFASRQSSVGGAVRAYGRLTAAAVALVTPGGTLVQASCSSRVSADGFRLVVLEHARDAGVELSDVTLTGQPLDHPVGFPEGAYLKAVVATVRS